MNFNFNNHFYRIYKNFKCFQKLLQLQESFINSKKNLLKHLKRFFTIYLSFNVISCKCYRDILIQQCSEVKISESRTQLDARAEPKTIFSAQTAFMGFLILFRIGENPDDYDFSPYINQIYIGAILMLMFCIVIWLKKNTFKIFLLKIFLKTLHYPFFNRLICFFCYAVLEFRKWYEENHNFIFPLIAIFINLTFLTNLAADSKTFLSNPFFYMFLWFTIGLTFINLDQFAINICNFLKEKPNHVFTKTFSLYLVKKKKTCYLEAGFFTKLGTLTAAGQAALYTGLMAAATGITITSINAYYSERKNLNKLKHASEEAQKNREAASEEAQRNREEAQRNREADIQKQRMKQEREKSRQEASATEAEKKRQYKTQKRKENAEAERIRQQERLKKWWEK